MDENLLTQKQRRFCEEYLVDLNAKQAAIRAGYSPNAAAEQGYENLIKPHVAAEIAKLRKEQSERTKVSADQVIEHLGGSLSITRWTTYASARTATLGST
jgi:phage terminase small subunit